MKLLQGATLDQLQAKVLAHLEGMGSAPAPAPAPSAAPAAAASPPAKPAAPAAVTPRPAPEPTIVTPSVAIPVNGSGRAPSPHVEPVAPAAAASGPDYASIDFTRWTPAQRIARGLVSGLVRAVADARIEGAEHMPASGPVLIAANHLSMWDAPVLLRFAERRTVIFAAEELRRFPWMHWTLHKLWDAIYLRRGEGDTEAMEQAAAVLRAGGVIGLSPEGIRNPGGLTRGLTGVAHLAFRTGAPIVPMAVFGQELIPSRAPRLRRTRVEVRIAAPIHAAGEPTAQAMQALTDRVMVQIARLLPPGYRGVYASEAAGEAER